MNETPKPMRKDMHTGFWQKGQLVVMFQLNASNLATLPKGGPSTFTKPFIVPLLNLDGLNSFLLENKVSLSSFTEKDTLRSANPSASSQPDENNLQSFTGKYLFRSRDEGQDVPTAVCFFNFEVPSVGTSPSTGSTSGMSPMSAGLDMAPGKGGGYGDKDGDDSGSKRPNPSGELVDKNVARIVDLINTHLSEPWNKQPGVIPVVAASPSWYCGGTTNGDPPRPTGCPAIPPIPVPAGVVSPSSPGLWPIILPDLDPDIKSMTGDGVTVFVLDTLPKQGEITRAVEGAEENNLLLLDVANNVIPNYHLLPDSLDVPGPLQPTTGKDIHGNLVGFRVPDHGLFIAGIIRDLAPSARVEAIRVLNDMCVGDMATLTKALEDIHDRMSPIDPNSLNDGGVPREGDLHNKPVVINMSLVVPLNEDEVRENGLESALDFVRKSLRDPLQSLINLGAVLVASAGNEADLRIDPSAGRPNAFYPAAFAYDGLRPPEQIIPFDAIEMIPVGAVDSKGNPASYSCYPGPRGIATFGGEVPDVANTLSPEGMTEPTNIDAVIGIYSALSYPALSQDDPQSRYPVPDANAWAYWVGTSFATPIISAVAARVLELKLRGKAPTHASVAYAVINAAGTQQINWTRLESGSVSLRGPMIKAVQLAV